MEKLRWTVLREKENIDCSALLQGSVDFLRSKGEDIQEIRIRPESMVGQLRVIFVMPDKQLSFPLEALSMLEEEDVLLDTIKENYDTKEKTNAGRTGGNNGNRKGKTKSRVRKS